ncbi:MAG TPA: AAA family ATPase [Tepidisphaeraceae bacterium]|jgi:putative nucleotidyltransferase with HDIG domain
MSDWTVPFCPRPPDWKLDWPAIESALDEVRALSGVPQDPLWHAEGDVLIRTRMVAEAMIAEAQWRSRGEQDRNVLFLSALLHDIGKTPTTRMEDGRIRSPRHSITGQRMARKLLWEATACDSPGFPLRETIASMVRYHGLPLMFVEKAGPERSIIEASMSVRCDHLALLARADVLGRNALSTADMLARIELFHEICAEQDCLNHAKAFESEHHRFIYFNANRDYTYVPFDDTRCEVTLMSGLPATGKNHWITQNAADLPVISLDDLRKELNIDPGEGSGTVANAAKEQAKVFLRQDRSFVWNATNITRELRQQLIALFANYKARIRTVYVECPPEELHARNHRRTDPVPTTVIQRLIEKLEVPTIVESHQLLLPF